MLDRNMINSDWIFGLVQFKNCLPGCWHAWSHSISVVVRIVDVLTHYLVTQFGHFKAGVPVGCRIPAEEVQFLFLGVGLMERDRIHVLAQRVIYGAGKMRDIHYSLIYM